MLGRHVHPRCLTRDYLPQIAEAVNAAGYHAFILQYRVHPNTHPAPLLDVRFVAIKFALMSDPDPTCTSLLPGH